MKKKKNEVQRLIGNVNKISILGTDDFTTSIAIIVRHSGSGAVGLAQVGNKQGRFRYFFTFLVA